MSQAAYSELKAAWHTDRIEALRRGEQIVPVELQLILSDYCNQDCFFCLTADAMVDTLTGQKSIAEIRVGDLVWGPDGELHEVTETSARYCHETVRVSVGGKVIEASPEHPILTAGGWVPAGEIKVGDSAVVRVRVRESSHGASRDVESLPGGPSAEAWGYASVLLAGVQANAPRQSDEASGSRGEGVGGYEGQATQALGQDSSADRVYRTAAHAVGPQPNERSRSAPGCHGEDTRSPDIEDGITLLGADPILGPSYRVDWTRHILDRSAQPGFPSEQAAQGDRANPEGMLYRIQEVAGLDELRCPDHPALPSQEVGMPGHFREGQGGLPDWLTRSDSRLPVQGIQLERGLEFRPIDSVLRVPARQIVYNFTCLPGHAYEANGVVVHNCAYRASNGLSSEGFADEQGNHNPKRMIHRDKAEEIIRQAAELGVKSIIFTGGGEPTAHPHHMEMFELALSLGLDCGLNTNGVIFRKGWEGVLPRFKYVRFSVDAGNANEYAEIRRTPAVQYGQALGNIRQLRDECDRQGSACVIGAGYVVTPDNWPNVKAGVAALKDAGCHYARLACMQSTEGRAPYGDQWDLASQAAAWAERQSTRDFKVINLFEDRLGIQPDYQFCGMQQFVLYIGANLKTYRCCYTAYTKHGETGDLANQTLAEWIASQAKRDTYATFDARSCTTCALDGKNRTINYMLDAAPVHVNFV